MAGYTNNFQSNAIPQNQLNINPLNQIQQPFGQNNQFILPQPVGNVYALNNSSEIGNIPISGSFSAGICFNEGILYIKTLQNNAPAMIAYKLVPLENTQPAQPEQISNKNFETLNSRLEKIEQLLNSKVEEGGKKWQL